MFRVFYTKVALFFICALGYALANTTVEKIEVYGAENITQEIAISALPFKEGASIDKQDITLAIKNLYATGMYEDINIDVAQGVVTINIKERAIVTEVNLSGGDDVIKKEQFEEMLQNIGLNTGKTLNPAVLHEVKNMVTALFKMRGYNSVEVNTHILKNGNGKVIVNVDINASDKTAISGIAISGNKFFSDSEILAVMKLKESGLFSYFFDNNTFSQELLAVDLNNIADLYYDRGFLNFNIVEDKVKFSKDNKQVSINIKLHEGEQYKVNKYSFSGKLPLPLEQLKSYVVLKEGQFFSRKKIKDSIANITRKLNDLGYVNVVISIDMKNIDATGHTVDVDFKLNSGHEYYVRNINFIGNYITDEKVLRQELKQLEGSRYSKYSLERSEQNLNNLGYLKSAYCKPENIIVDSDWIDITCNVTEENKSSTLTGELGVSDTDGFFYGVNYKQNNFLGSGNSVSLEFNKSKKESVYKIFHSWPHLTYDGLSSNVSLYYKNSTPNRVNIAQYHSNNYGLEFGFGLPVADSQRLHTSIGAEHLNIITFADSPSQVTDYVNAYGDTFNQLKFSLNWTYKTLNRMVFPSSGTNSNFAADIGVPYNGNNDTLSYYKFSYNTSWYHSLYKTDYDDGFTLLLHGKYGYGNGFSNQNGELPFFKNFYAGGLGSVRGFKSNSLGPVAVKSDGSLGSAIGGNILLAENVNIILPQFVKEDMRFSLFFDIGNVFADDISWHNMQYSAGVTLQWQTAMAPLVFSFGFPLGSYNKGNKDSFAFSISTDFV